MKQTINKIHYNTETATFVGEAYEGENISDFSYWEAGLYRTPRKRYFIAGRGGAMTPFAHRAEGGWGGGPGILPLTRMEAFEWACAHLEDDEVEEEFGDLIEP